MFNKKLNLICFYIACIYLAFTSQASALVQSQNDANASDPASKVDSSNLITTPYGITNPQAKPSLINKEASGSTSIKSNWVAGNACVKDKCGKMLIYDGVINKTAVEQLELALQNEKSTTTVLLNSTSGDLNSGIKIGQLIHEKRLNTLIGRAQVDQKSLTVAPGQCYSACVLAFAGGINRSISPNDQVGFRALLTKRDIKDVDTKFAINKLELFFDEMGVDRKIINEMINTKIADINLLSLDAAKRFNLDNSASKKIHPWTLGVMGSPETLIGLVTENQSSALYSMTLGLTSQGKNFRLTIYIRPLTDKPNLPKLAEYLAQNNRLSIKFDSKVLQFSGAKPWEASSNGVVTSIYVTEKDLKQLSSSLEFTVELEDQNSNSFNVDKTTLFSTVGLKGVILSLKK